MEEMECIAEDLLTRWDNLAAVLGHGVGMGISNDETDGE